LVGRRQRPAASRSIASCAALPGPALAEMPAPISTAFTACTDITACARRPSSFSSQCTCEPSPAGTLCAITVTAPPRVSPAVLVSSTSATIAGSRSRAMARSGELSSTLLEVAPVGNRPVDSDRAEEAHAAPDLDPGGQQEHAREGAGGNAGGGLARRRALEDVAQVRALVLEAAGEVGVPGTRRVHTPRLGLRRVERSRVHRALPVDVVAVGDPERDGEPSVSLPRTPPWTSTVSCSICMRRPRPWPCWRRARSRARRSKSTRKPAGRPCRIAVRPGPWLSPAVLRRMRRMGAAKCSTRP
jgi:hypothetical protein